MSCAECQEQAMPSDGDDQHARARLRWAEFPESRSLYGRVLAFVVPPELTAGALTPPAPGAGAATAQSASRRLGVVLGSFALYGRIAPLLEEATRRTVLPLGRRCRYRTSPEGRVAATHQEAGVRRRP